MAYSRSYFAAHDFREHTSSKSVLEGFAIACRMNDLSSLSVHKLGFGMLSMSVGNVCWSVVEGQGRVRLATSIEMIISWLVAIPLSYVLVYVFNYNLLGVVASLVVAYTITGQWMTYLVFCSDWTLLSKIVNERSRSRCDRCNTGSDNSNVHTSAIYDDCYWDELPEDVQAAAVVLGYTKSIWNKDGTPESDDKYWHQLCPDQQQAAQKLGFTEDTWDEDSSSSSSSSSDDSAS